MSRGKTKRKRRKPSKGSAPKPKGYDFGSSERSLLVASFDFVKALHDADIFGCAYGMSSNNVLRTALIEVSLIGKNADSLESAFQEFIRWGADEDGDVVALTFVFLKEGGYLLGVGHDVERLEHRLRANDRVFVPLYYGGSWVKKFDSRHAMLKQLAEYKKSLISPFLFSAAFHPPADDPADLNLNSIRPIQGIEPIIKLEATFTLEEDVQDHSQEWGLLQIYRSKEPTSNIRDANDRILKLSEPGPKDDLQSFLDRRQEMLFRHFPVTLSRLRRSKEHMGYLKELIGQGVRQWQVEQALCNLILSREICEKDHYIGLSQKESLDKIISALQSRFEQADSVDSIAELTLDAIQHQIELDSKVLLSHFKVRPKAMSLRSLVGQLDEEGLLA